MRSPHAFRPLKGLYMSVSKVVADDKYLEMTENEFVITCLQVSGGNIDPAALRKVYFDLMKDAGIAALHSPMKSDAEDNGDHSWEYYSEGKVVNGDEFFKTAHESYFKS